MNSSDMFAICMICLMRYVLRIAGWWSMFGMYLLTYLEHMYYMFSCSSPWLLSSDMFLPRKYGMVMLISRLVLVQYIRRLGIPGTKKMSIRLVVVWSVTRWIDKKSLLVYWFGMYCMNFPLKNSMVVLLLCCGVEGSFDVRRLRQWLISCSRGSMREACSVNTRNWPDLSMGQTMPNDE